MFKKSVWLHLRIPFSLYLMPFFCFALSQSQEPKLLNIILSFFIIHLFFYPASNGYNSYFDKDEESIGGLKNPPPVDKSLYNISLLFDVIALGLSLIISWQFALMILGIGFVSKAYSHPAVRLKKYPILGLVTVALFQGAYTYLMSYLAINNYRFPDLLNLHVFIPAGLCSLILLGSYPMTQIYQHNEDGRRGDHTISRMLGIKGTFVWTGSVFGLGMLGFYFFLSAEFSFKAFLIFLVIMIPTLIYFFTWFQRVLDDEKNADFESTMKLNKISSVGFIIFFLVLALL